MIKLYFYYQENRNKLINRNFYWNYFEYLIIFMLFYSISLEIINFFFQPYTNQ